MAMGRSDQRIMNLVECPKGQKHCRRYYYRQDVLVALRHADRGISQDVHEVVGLEDQGIRELSGPGP